VTRTSGWRAVGRYRL